MIRDKAQRSVAVEKYMPITRRGGKGRGGAFLFVRITNPEEDAISFHAAVSV
jgi:hypothetical protein